MPQFPNLKNGSDRVATSLLNGAVIRMGAQVLGKLLGLLGFPDKTGFLALPLPPWLRASADEPVAVGPPAGNHPAGPRLLMKTAEMWDSVGALGPRQTHF